MVAGDELAHLEADPAGTTRRLKPNMPYCASANLRESQNRPLDVSVVN